MSLRAFDAESRSYPAGYLNSSIIFDCAFINAGKHRRFLEWSQDRVMLDAGKSYSPTLTLLQLWIHSRALSKLACLVLWKFVAPNCAEAACSCEIPSRGGEWYDFAALLVSLRQIVPLPSQPCPSSKIHPSLSDLTNQIKRSRFYWTFHCFAILRPVENELYCRPKCTFCFIQGSILNRFSRDMGFMDDILPYTLFLIFAVSLLLLTFRLRYNFCGEAASANMY